MGRMLRKNYHRQPGRVPGHGESCGACKPDDYKGRAKERREWVRDNENMLNAYGIEAKNCGCWTCVDEVVSARPFPENLMYPFIVCATCGNKRCPRAEHHDNACSGSNAPGQVGSTRYPI